MPKDVQAFPSSKNVIWLFGLKLIEQYQRKNKNKTESLWQTAIIIGTHQISLHYTVFFTAVYWASFLDTIRYNTFSCNIRYIGWTIYLIIFGEKDQKRPRRVMVYL